jgi:hypothetical protein
LCRVSLALLLAALLLPPASLLAQGSGLTVRVDPRVELLAIVFRLAGNPEYNQGRVPGYIRAIDEHFGPFREHPAVVEARRLRLTRGVSFDAVMSMAIHIDDGETPAPRREFTAEDPSLERRWMAAEANGFIARLAEFAREARFAEFIRANRATLDTAYARMQRVVDTHLKLALIQDFFGRGPTGTFIMVPLVANAAGNFGPRYIEGDREEVYAIIGTSPDSAGWPAFDARFIPTMVHEFSHSFVNPAVGAVSDRFRAAGEAIFPRVATEMRRQAYGTWLIMINESLVRASVARYILATAGEEAARREVAQQRARGFYWTDELFDLLGEYERDRARYPSLDTFLPRVAEYFERMAPGLEARIAEFDRARPAVLSTDPGHEAVGVDPALDRIVIRFDQPMGPGYNIRLGPGGRERFPEISTVEWDESGTVLTVWVKLKPAWKYETVLGSGFVSRSAMPLKDRPLSFTTR